MREIKFRAWDKQHKKMYYDVQNTYDGRLADYFGQLLTWEGEDGDLAYEVMQFTGLTDKNGKEIFEGDIVKLHYGSIYSVEYIQRLALYSICRPVGNVASYPFIDYDRCEVIGNIYDNPELIQ